MGTPRSREAGRRGLLLTLLVVAVLLVALDLSRRDSLIRSLVRDEGGRTPVETLIQGVRGGFQSPAP